MKTRIILLETEYPELNISNILEFAKDNEKKAR
jgi:hypothetical protein